MQATHTQDIFIVAGYFFLPVKHENSSATSFQEYVNVATRGENTLDMADTNIRDLSLSELSSHHCNANFCIQAPPDRANTYSEAGEGVV